MVGMKSLALTTMSPWNNSMPFPISVRRAATESRICDSERRASTQPHLNPPSKHTHLRGKGTSVISRLMTTRFSSSQDPREPIPMHIWTKQPLVCFLCGTLLTLFSLSLGGPWTSLNPEPNHHGHVTDLEDRQWLEIWTCIQKCKWWHNILSTKMKSKDKMSKARGLTYISSDKINSAKQKKESKVSTDLAWCHINSHVRSSILTRTNLENILLLNKYEQRY